MMIFQNKTSLIIVLCSIVYSGALFAEMYKWVDEDGNTHYTQSPPNQDVEIETIKSPPKVDTDSAVKSLEEQKKTADKLREDRLTTAEKKQKAEEEELEKQRRCEQARKSLNSFTTRPRVTAENPDGSTRIMTEEERQAEIQKSRESVKQHCN